MTGYDNKFDKNDDRFNKNGNKFNKNVTMSFRVNNNKQLLKNYNKIWKKNWKTNEHRFWKQTYLW